MHNTWAHQSGDLSGSTAILSTFQDGILVMAGVGDSGNASSFCAVRYLVSHALDECRPMWQRCAAAAGGSGAGAGVAG